MWGDADDVLRVELDGPGSGLGLIGIAERVEVAGGRFIRVVADGEFTMSAWLPGPT